MRFLDMKAENFQKTYLILGPGCIGQMTIGVLSSLLILQTITSEIYPKIYPPHILGQSITQNTQRSYCLIEKKWREKHPNKEDLKDDAMPVATQLAQEWEMANTQSDIRPSDSILNDRITEEWQERLKIF